jgi:hypothetical protein
MLTGGTETLRRFRPILWLEIVDTQLARAGDNAAALWDFLGTRNYRAFTIGADGAIRPLGTVTEGDILWVPEEKAGDVEGAAIRG